MAEPTDAEIKVLLTRHEDATFDRTSSLENKDSVGANIASFATSSGGVLLVGQDKQGNLVGIGSNIEEFLRNLGHILESTDPKPTVDGPYFSQVEGKQIAIIRVISLGPGGPCSYKDNAYRRVLDRSERIPPRELHRIWSSAGKLHFEERPTSAPLSAVDRTEIEFYSQDARKNLSFEETKFLLARKLAVAGSEGQPVLTNLGVIVLSQKPVDWLTYAKVHLVRFKGIMPGERIGATTLSLPIRKCIEASFSFVKSFMPVTEKREGIKRVEEPLIPDFVLREAIVNAFSHRDYEDPGEILVRVFDDRVEISNPGAPKPEEWKAIELSGIPVHRNPLLYDFLWPAQLGEGVGQGIPEMRRLLKAANLPEPLFTQIQNTFNVVLYNKPVGGYAQSLSNQVIRLIHKEKRVSTTRLMSVFKVSRPYILSILHDLEAKGYVRHTGGGPTSRYELADNPKL